MGSIPRRRRGINPNKLSDKQYRFVHEYLIHMDAKKAAIEAGYSPKNAAVQGAKLLDHKLVRKALGKLLKDVDIEKLLTVENVLEELSYCLFRDASDFVDKNGHIITNLSSLPLRAQKAIDGFKFKQFLNPDGDVVGQELEVKLVPKATMVKLAMDYFNLLQPSVTNNNQVYVNWDKLLEQTKPTTPQLE